MSCRQTLAYRFLVLACLAISLCLPAQPVLAADATVTSHLFWTATGTANPDLTYKFQAQNQGFFSSMSTPELLFPVTLFGRILKDGGISLGTCSDLGFVEDLSFECWEPSMTSMVSAPCPFAEGVWRGLAQMTTPLQSFAGMSNIVIANCPPVCTDIPSFTANLGAEASDDAPVSSAFRASLVAGIDLETGYQIDRTLTRAIPHDPLHRVTKIDGTTYVLDEYAVVEISDEGQTRVERASSPRSVQAASAWGQALRSLQAQVSSQGVSASSGRYLLIQGMEHLTGERRPMIKFQPPAGVSLAQSEQVVVRARFSASGEVETVDSFEGDLATARELAEAIELSFIGEVEHRVVVYAVFRGGQRPELTAAVPTYIQCCCDGFLCPG